jgi:hypothetical protein
LPLEIWYFGIESRLDGRRKLDARVLVRHNEASAYPNSPSSGRQLRTQRALLFDQMNAQPKNGMCPHFLQGRKSRDCGLVRRPKRVRITRFKKFVPMDRSRSKGDYGFVDYTSKSLLGIIFKNRRL